MRLKQLCTGTLAIASILGASLPVFGQSFPDVPDAYWGKSFIDSAVEKGFFSGDAEGNFSPDNNITRNEFIIVMMNLRNFSANPLEEGAIWYSGFFTAAQEIGLLPDYFTLDNFTTPITREEMAFVLIKTLGEGNFDLSQVSAPNFSDADQIQEVFMPYVAQAVESGLMSGTDEGFSPKSSATRVQGAIVAVQTYDKFLSEGEDSGDYGVGDMLPESNVSPLSRQFAQIIDRNRTSSEIADSPVCMSTSDEQWMMIQMLMHLDSDTLDGFAIAYPSIGINAYCVAIMKPTEGTLSELLSNIERFQEDKINGLEGYIQDQELIAREAITFVTADDTVVFVMHPEAKTLADALVLELS